jgi:hypothetical protein
MIGSFGSILQEAPYILEEMIENWDKQDAKVKNQLLVSSLKLFFGRPKEMKLALGLCYIVYIIVYIIVLSYKKEEIFIFSSLKLFLSLVNIQKVNYSKKEQMTFQILMYMTKSYSIIDFSLLISILYVNYLLSSPSFLSLLPPSLPLLPTSPSPPFISFLLPQYSNYLV